MNGNRSPLSLQSWKMFFQSRLGSSCILMFADTPFQVQHHQRQRSAMPHAGTSHPHQCLFAPDFCVP
jgi:hypothetical protein